MSSLVLHRGGYHISRETLATLPTPEPTDTHFPIPHAELVEKTVGQLADFGFSIVHEEHGLHKDANRYFGIFDVKNGHTDDDWGLTIGLRNSHDKAFASSIAMGSHVFVCDNLSFHSEIAMERKHTRFISRDLPQLIHNTMGRLLEHRNVLDQQITDLKQQPMDNTKAHDLVIRALDAKVIGVGRVEAVLEQWRKPPHVEFEPRNAWSLFNAFTQVLKTYCADAMVERSQRLHSVFAVAV